MRSVPSRLLVIDASVARSAGETEHPVSSSCRAFLLAVLKICHRVAVTTDIREEWQRHQSRFTRKWRCSMAAPQKPLRDIKPVSAGLNIPAFAPPQQVAIEKDLGLLEAALGADGVIVTRDDALRKALGTTPQGSRLRDRITWYNPVTDGTEPLWEDGR